jgi:hypothetical protein
MKYRNPINPYVYNVLIGGTSIGLTPKRREAEAWYSDSMYKGKKEIVKVANCINQSDYREYKGEM